MSQRKNKINKDRLDVVIHKQRPDLSRSLIQAWIKQGMVSVLGQVVYKPGLLVEHDVQFSLQIEKPVYVSRSGAKLEQALQAFKVDVTDLVALDIGLSTGGFTDCLLQAGVSKVFGVDVGTDQVHYKIKQDARVVVMEQTDIRTCIGKIAPVDFICIDVSFISVTKIIDVVAQLLKPAGNMIILIKPQFEGGFQAISRGGIVKDEVIRKRIVQDVMRHIEQAGFTLQNYIESSTIGGDGNIEYLAYFIK